MENGLRRRDEGASGLLRIYRALVRAALAEALEYRVRAILWLVTAVFPLVMMVVWLAVAAEVGDRLGWSSTDFISYYVGAALIQRFTNSWAAWGWERDIRDGGLSVKLLRPCDPAHHYLAEQLGWKLFDLCVLVPLAILAALLIPAVQFPLDAARLGALILAVAAGFLLSELMGYTFGVIAFWTTQSTTLYSLLVGAGQFLSGWVAPLELYPTPLRAVAAVLPFRTAIDLPVSILIGRASWPEIRSGLLIAAGWILLFLLLYRVLYTLGLRRYEAVGA